MNLRRSLVVAAVALLVAVVLVGLPWSRSGGTQVSWVPPARVLVLWLAGAAGVLASLAAVHTIARHRGDASDATTGLAPRVRCFPMRRHYVVLATLYLLIALYGSFVPFQFHPLDLRAALDRFANLQYLHLAVTSRADWVANILLFIPLSYLLMAVLVVDVESRLARAAALLSVIVGCAILSVLVEFGQLWFPVRTVSRNDIIAESIGGVLGAGLWLAMGPTLTDWVRGYTAATQRRTQVDRLLEFYLAGLVIYSLMPLDLTISPAELMRKMLSGRVVLVPFSDLPWGLELPFRLATDMALFAPLGMYLATAWTSASRPLRSLGACCIWGAVIAAAIELAQFPIYSRTTSATEVVIETVGVLLGAALMRRWRGAAEGPARSSESRPSRSGMYLAAAGIYSLVLVAIFCAGGNWTTDPAQLRQRFGTFWCIPFASLYRGSEFNALSDALRKILFFMPLGALWALAIVPARLSPAVRRIFLGAGVAYAAGVSFAIEMVQVLVPGHFPDVTDVLLGTLGGSLGLLVAWKAIHAPETASPPGGPPPTAPAAPRSGETPTTASNH